VQKFLNHYYPYTPTPPQPTNSNDAPSLSGTYQNTRSVYTTVFKYFSMPQTVDVVGYPNGTLQVTSSAVSQFALLNRSVDLVEVAPLVFARPDGNTTIAGISHFIFTIGGNGTYYHGDAIPQYYEHLPCTPPQPASRTSDTSAWRSLPRSSSGLSAPCVPAGAAGRMT
jgi:hypothetical protein